MLISRYQIQARKCYGHLGCSCFQSAGEANAETCALHAFSIILLFLQSPVSKGPCKTFGTTAALTPKLESGSESTGESLQFVDFVVRSFEFDPQLGSGCHSAVGNLGNSMGNSMEIPSFLILYDGETPCETPRCWGFDSSKPEDPKDSTGRSVTLCIDDLGQL